MEEWVAKIMCILTRTAEGLRVPARITEGTVYVTGETQAQARTRATHMLYSKYLFPAEQMVWEFTNTHLAQEQERQARPAYFEGIEGFEGFEGLAKKVAIA